MFPLSGLFAPPCVFSAIRWTTAQQTLPPPRLQSDLRCTQVNTTRTRPLQFKCTKNHYHPTDSLHFQILFTFKFVYEPQFVNQLVTPYLKVTYFFAWADLCWSSTTPSPGWHVTQLHRTDDHVYPFTLWCSTRCTTSSWTCCDQHLQERAGAGEAFQSRGKWKLQGGFYHNWRKLQEPNWSLELDPATGWDYTAVLGRDIPVPPWLLLAETGPAVPVIQGHAHSDKGIKKQELDVVSQLMNVVE